MFDPTTVAWIYWDPDPTAFFIPIVNHPIKWYGLFFVAGLIGASLIFLYLLRNKLYQEKGLKERDIRDWKGFSLALTEAAKAKTNPLYPAAKALETQSLLKESLSQKELCKFFQTFNQQASSLNRQQIEQQLPKAIIPLKELSSKYLDKLIWFIVIGIVIGARLGHVFFYEWEYYSNHPFSIPKVWEGGLASHGGTLGVLIALFLYSKWTKNKFPDISFISLCDLMAIPASFAAIFIRIGNFFNQEIIGEPSTAPWAIIFGHPADYASSVPRHPVQLYEAAAYFLTFIILLAIWKVRSDKLPQGMLLGFMFVLIFGARFVIEFVKAPLGNVFDETFLQTGQLLSIPFIAAGFALIFLDKIPKLRSSL